MTLLYDTNLDKNKIEYEDKRCRILGLLVKKTDNMYLLNRIDNEYYYKLHKLESKINTANLLTAPVHIKDIGIGGGERYFLCGNNQNEKVLPMIGNSYKMRLIYGNKSIVGTLTSFRLNNESIVITTEDGYSLECTLKECDIEILDIKSK